MEDPLILILQHEQQERISRFPNPEDFKKSRLDYALFLEKDHANHYRQKAQKYKINSIQYNKNMARYNELIKEITDLRTEAAAGKTTEELRLEAAILQNKKDREEEARKDKEEDDHFKELSAKTNEELIKLSASHNSIWGDRFKTWPERWDAKHEVMRIIRIMKSRGVDIIPALDEQLRALGGV